MLSHHSNCRVRSRLDFVSPSLNGSSLFSLETCRTSPEWNCWQFENSCQVFQNVLDNFCQLDTNVISTFRGCLQLTVSPFQPTGCEEILPGCKSKPPWGRPSGSFYRALHLSEFRSVLFFCTKSFPLFSSQKQTGEYQITKKRSVSRIRTWKTIPRSPRTQTRLAGRSDDDCY